MNGRFRKTSALFATVALVSAGMVGMFASSAGATSQIVTSSTLNYGSTGWAGWSCPAGTHIVSATTILVGTGTNGTAEIVLWKPGATTTTGSPNVSYPNTPFGYTYGAGEEGALVHKDINPGQIQIVLVCATAPVAPTVTVTALTPTSASLSTVGDSDPAGTVHVVCTQSPSFTNSGTLGDGSVSWPNQTGLATNGAPIICTGTETANSLTGPAGTGQAYLKPPAPIGVNVTQKDLTSVTVGFTGQGTNIDHYTATCTSSAGGSHSATGAASPIVVGGFSNLATQTITCSVTETFVAPNSLTGDPSANGSGVMFGASGPGCSGTISGAPKQISAAAQAYPGAQVSWAPVTVDPASCLAGYLVTPSTGLAKFVSSNETTTLMAGPFTFGSTVTFTVAAVSGSTVGPASDAISVTIGAPATVKSVHVAHVGKGAVKVAFQAGANNGAAIKRFTATCGGKSTSGKSSPLIVRGLKAGRTYTCTVTATNSRGTGAAARSTGVKA